VIALRACHPVCAASTRAQYVRTIRSRSILNGARERNPLPPGAGSVGVALVVAGLTAYGFLIVSARALGKDEYAPLSVLWVLALVGGPGFFLPVEQEIARAMADRRARGFGGGPVVRRAMLLAVGLLGCLLLVGGITGPVLVDQVFSDHWAILLAWLLTLVAACGAHLARGVLSGLERFNAYAQIIGGESAVRFAGAVVLWLVGVKTVGPYGMVLALGPIVAVLATLRGQSDLVAEGPPAEWREVTTALAWLLLGSVASMAIVNAGPIAMEVLAKSGEHDEAGRFLSGLVIARIPLFLFQAVQAALLPRLSGLAGSGRVQEFREGLGRLVAVVGAVAVVGCVGAALLGPTVVQIAFGGDFELSHRTMTLLGLGNGAFMLASLIAQGSIALGGHRRMALAWAAAAVVLVGVTAWSSEDLFLRVELGCVAGGGAALVVQALVLWRLLASGAEVHAGDLIEAIHGEPVEP